MEIDFLLSNESKVNFKKRVGESSEVLPRLTKSPYKTYFLNIPFLCGFASGLTLKNGRITRFIDDFYRKYLAHYW